MSPLKPIWRLDQRSDLDFRELAYVIGQRRWLMLAVTVGFVLAAIGVGYLTAPGYRAEALVEIQGIADPNSQGSEEPAAQKVLNAMLPGELAGKSAQRVGWRAGVKDFQDRLSVAQVPGTGEVRVSFVSRNPEEAAAAANAAAEVLVEYVQALGQRKLAGGTLNARAQLIKRAEAPPVRWFNAYIFYWTLPAGLLGFFTGGALALLLESRARRWRGVVDAEVTLRVPVLGTIPHQQEREEAGEKIS